MKLSVVIPSYRRPASLVRCLDGLAQQTRPPDEVIVVARPDDAETLDVVRAARLPVAIAEVTTAGLLAAMRAGADAATGDVIAFTDDDAVARPDWAGRLEAHFADPAVGGAGGRDFIAEETEGETWDFGRITRWGRLVGNHHLAIGPPKPVDVLKGVNMAFRRAALALPTDLRGEGAQLHSEIAICGWASSRGWRLILDPEAIVDHTPAWRPAGDSRRRRHHDTRDAAFNFVFGVMCTRPGIARRRAVYGVLIGDWLTPGIVRIAVALALRERGVLRIAPSALLGQLEAIAAFARGRRQQMVPVSGPP